MDNKNEMEQIQRGLEDFLEKEMGHAGKTTHGGQGVPTGEQPGRTARGRDTEDSVRIIGQRANAQEIDYGRDPCSRNEGTGSRSCGTEEFHRPGYDEEEAEPERFYHGFVLGLMVELADKYVLTSNRESGFGRYDVMLEPKTVRGDGVKTGGREADAIIIEFKVQDSSEEKELASALDR